MNKIVTIVPLAKKSTETWWQPVPRSREHRCRRGGSWLLFPETTSSMRRYLGHHVQAEDNVGFRVVCNAWREEC
jgi:hypothetical protein